MANPPLPFSAKTNVSWPGEEEGDLGFLENEIIEVLAIVDDSWWSGRLKRNKAEGVFPSTYVEIIEDSLNKSIMKTSNASRTKVFVKNMNENVPPSLQQVQEMNESLRETDKKYFEYESKKKPVNLHKASKSKEPKYYNHPTHSISQPQLHQSSRNTPPQSISQSYEVVDDYEDDTPPPSAPENFKAKSYKKQSNGHLNASNSNLIGGFDSPEDIEREIERLKILQKQHQSMLQQHQQSKKIPKSHSYNEIGDNKYTQHKQYSDSRRERHRDRERDREMRDRETRDLRDYNQTINKSFQQPMPPNKSSKMVHSASDMTLTKSNHSPAKQTSRIDLTKPFDIEKDELANYYRSTKLDKESRSPYHQSTSPLEKYKNLDYDYDDNYSYDDSKSSRKYQSQDNLSKKLSKYISDSESDDELQPPPPLPPKHQVPISNSNPKRKELESRSHYRNSKDGEINKFLPYDADDFNISSNTPVYEEEFRLSQLSQYQQVEELRSSIKSLQSDVLNLSELSATSAGSFNRHKFERNLQEQQLKLQSLSLLNENMEHDKSMNMADLLQDKKSKHPNIFKKILNKNKMENLVEQKFSQEDENDWMELKSDLFRINSLTSKDKQDRTRRVAREEDSLILKPFEFITEINKNETKFNNIIDDFDEELDLSTLNRVDQFMNNYSNKIEIGEFIYDISIKFKNSKIDQIRCILLYLCKFKIIEENDKISQIKPKSNEVSTKNELTIFQLVYIFKKILDSLNIESEIVLGFWKKPNEFYHQDNNFIINHCWLSVFVDGQFRIVDLLLFKNYKICNLKNFNEFYFLSKPLELISTHLPSIIDLQHVVPPIDQNIAFTLPRLFSGYYKNNLKIINFNNALTKLKDLEFFEIDIEIPINIELFTLIKTSKITTNELTLCQVYWSKNKRIAKIKALLPENESIGFLQIFSGLKGLQKYFDNIHELSISIPLYHEGLYKRTKFIPRFPTVQSQSNDLYVKQPQINKLIVKNSYNFQILQNPSNGLNSFVNSNFNEFKLAIEAPSGKYYKLVKEDNKPYGVYELNIKCSEIGTYRGLVIGDSGNSWYVFSQWECVGSL